MWTIDHVRLTNPGGVGGRIQLATLSAADGKQPTVTVLAEDHVQEHLQQIRAAEGALVEELRASAQAQQTSAPPEVPR